MYLNKTFICGKACNTPELRYTKTKIPVTNFTIKEVQKWIDKETGSKKINTNYHKIVCWGKLAKQACSTVNKDTTVLVVGEISYHEQADNVQIINGVEKPIINTEIKASIIQANPVLNERSNNEGYSED